MIQNGTHSTHDARKPTDADRYVGQQLRQGRRELGLTQEALAGLLGITFQQVQKYETGRSRISAGRLRDAAISLQKPITFFYEPFEEPVSSTSTAGAQLQLRDLRRDARRLLDEIEDPSDLAIAVRILSALKDDDSN
ncbi:MAG: helix-turn-helix domain-containing protein [Hyphomonas sp.]